MIRKELQQKKENLIAQRVEAIKINNYQKIMKLDKELYYLNERLKTKTR